MKIFSFRFSLFILGFSFFVLQSCVDCVKGEGELVEETRILKPFEILVVNGSADLIIYQTRRQKVEELVVKAQKNLIPYITTENEGSKLVIDMDGCIESTKQIEIYLGFNSISKIISNGSGDITGENIIKADELKLVQTGSADIQLKVKGNELEINHEGSGDIYLEGKYDYSEIYHVGSGNIKAYDLTLEKADILNEGSGDVNITVTKELIGRTLGSGDISYKGKPEVTDVLNEGSGIINSKE